MHSADQARNDNIWQVRLLCLLIWWSQKSCQALYAWWTVEQPVLLWLCFFLSGMWGNNRDINPRNLYLVAWNTEFFCRLFSGYCWNFPQKTRATKITSLSAKGIFSFFRSLLSPPLFWSTSLFEFSPLSWRITYYNYN